MWTEITRRKYQREGQRYASDLTDAEWALIEPQMRQLSVWAGRARPNCATCCDLVYRADRLSVANAVEGVPAVHHGARLFLRLARQWLV